MNDVLQPKRTTIERCVEQIRRYASLPTDVPLEKEFFRQDAISTNIQRA